MVIGQHVNNYRIFEEKKVARQTFVKVIRNYSRYYLADAKIHLNLIKYCIGSKKTIIKRA